MPRTVLQCLLGWRGRLSREPFILSIALLTIIGLIVLRPLVDGAGGTGPITFLAIGYVLVTQWVEVALLAKRCRDMGLPDWYGFAALIPVLGEPLLIVAAFVPTDAFRARGPND